MFAQQLNLTFAHGNINHSHIYLFCAHDPYRGLDS